MAEHLEALCQGKAELLLEGVLPVRLVARQEAGAAAEGFGGKGALFELSLSFSHPKP